MKRITSKNDGNFYCLNCLNSFRAENKFKSHEKVCKYKDFGGNILPSQRHIMLYIIYADLKSRIKKIDGSAKNLENPSATKVKLFYADITCQLYGLLII